MYVVHKNAITAASVTGGGENMEIGIPSDKCAVTGILKIASDPRISREFEDPIILAEAVDAITSHRLNRETNHTRHEFLPCITGKITKVNEIPNKPLNETVSVNIWRILMTALTT